MNRCVLVNPSFSAPSGSGLVSEQWLSEAVDFKHFHFHTETRLCSHEVFYSRKSLNPTVAAVVFCFALNPFPCTRKKIFGASLNAHYSLRCPIYGGWAPQSLLSVDTAFLCWSECDGVKVPLVFPVAGPLVGLSLRQFGYW